MHVTLLGGDHGVRLLDVSRKGALIKHDGSWAAQSGQKCHLRLELGPGAVIVMEATFAHVDGRHLGSHGNHIDIDNIAHLRQLVELNAGDPALLERDLGKLVSRN